MQFTSKDLAEKYNRLAYWYDIVEGIPDTLGVRKLRRRLLEKASGEILEVAAGTGKNLPFYAARSGLIAVYVSDGMLDRARKRAGALSLRVLFSIMDAQALAFSDGSFDTVFSSLTVCTFPNPIRALQEMGRVCRPSGRVLLLEHGRSDCGWLGRWLTAGQKGMPSSSGATGTENRWSLSERPA
ncbi:MAG: class I SAM-dependent methyltransferase [Deltaproteobacteria bacterium]|nr:class I SAM-dependent methyltransferase [Deltaproteobacteria bacterium]